MIIGTRQQTLGMNCAYCGFPTCSSKPADTPCAINSIDLGIAIGSACATAADLRLDTRVMFSAGLAAQRLGWLGESKSLMAIPVSASSKNMSPSNRNSRWANSGMVVEIHPEDFPSDSPLSLLEFQEQFEKLCWQNGGCKQTAPAQRMVDFVNKKLSSTLPISSYTPGLVSSPLHFWMPDFVTSRLRDGFRYFGKVSQGFLTNEALMIGVETRTSSPVRILRDKETYQHGLVVV